MDTPTKEIVEAKRLEALKRREKIETTKTCRSVLNCCIARIVKNERAEEEKKFRKLGKASIKKWNLSPVLELCDVPILDDTMDVIMASIGFDEISLEGNVASMAIANKETTEINLLTELAQVTDAISTEALSVADVTASGPNGFHETSEINLLSELAQVTDAISTRALSLVVGNNDSTTDVEEMPTVVLRRSSRKRKLVIRD